MVDALSSFVVYVRPFTVEGQACFCDKDRSVDGCSFLCQCPFLWCEVIFSNEFFYTSTKFGDLGAVKVVMLSCFSGVCAHGAVLY